MGLMSKPREPVPALMICGILFSSRHAYEDAVIRLQEKFGAIATRSQEWDFVHTTYYCPEMGPDITRVFLVFSQLVPQDCLVEAKHSCRSIEEEFMVEISGGRRGRRVNIDPGLLTPERLVLATNKNFTHRIYLSGGVFAEITLMATRSGFRPLEWTFPDYASPEILEFWNDVRRDYLQRLKREGLL